MQRDGPGTQRAPPPGPAAAAAAVREARRSQDGLGDAQLCSALAGGPLAERLGWAAERPRGAALDRLLGLGRWLGGQLGFDPDAPLSVAQTERIYQYYLPVYAWMRRQMAERAEARAAAGGQRLAGPLVLGISAPQGCGKTTIVSSLEGLFAHEGLRAVTVSIDDFYRTFAEQRRLAEEEAPGNPLLELRGNAGSHDLALWEDTLQALQRCTGPGARARVPRYDKSRHGGRGDRAPEADWVEVEGRVDVVLLEGWMLGFEPVGAERAAEVHPGLPAVDARLGAYSKLWAKYVESCFVVRVGDPAWVGEWRLQAEHQMRAAGKPGLSDEEVADFVARYMPAYSAYLPGLYAGRGVGGAPPARVLELEVDQRRSPRRPGGA